MNGNGNYELLIVSETAPLTEGQNPQLLYKIDLKQVMHLMTPGNSTTGKQESLFDEFTAHNVRGAQLYYSPDTLGETLTGMHIYGFQHENMNTPGQVKGRILEEVDIETDADGKVVYLGITNANGKIDIYPSSDYILLEKYDPDNPPSTMHAHQLEEIRAGHEIPYTVVPNGSSKFSTLTLEQFTQIQQIMEAGLQFIVPSVEITQQSGPPLLPRSIN